MEKYLGNKRVLLNDIYEFVEENCPGTNSICDIFSGTTNVGRFFSNKGYKVYSNDINRFSYIIGRCYFGLSSNPQFEKITLPDNIQLDLNSIEESLQKTVNRDKNIILTNFILKDFIKNNTPALRVINYLNNICSHKTPTYSFIKEYYTIFGSNSNFISQRGTVGKRNYFSEENALKIDLILEQIREWYQSNQIDENEIVLLLTSVLEEIVLVANVNGTFHDFNRDRLWPNSLQNFTLKLPLYQLYNNNHFYCDDAANVIKFIPHHDILYVDPPYNFRQYTAYYHFINFISAYPFLNDLEQYLNNIEFVRGQNMADDFTSNFCFQDLFTQQLKELISHSKSRFVVVSYYGGRNHWNHWSKEEVSTDNGFNQITTIFEDKTIFKKYKAESLFQKRQNYQSRGGEKKEFIDEYLFFGEKIESEITHEAVLDEFNGLSKPNQILNLSFFKPTLSSVPSIY